jgi:type IV secretion system protein VirB8
MLSRKTSSKKIDEAVAHSINFEVTVADLARRSEKRAWWVAFTAVGLSLILAGGYFYMLPLKEKVPYIVMADAYTGTSTVARLTEDFTNRQISTSEAINRSNIAHFVLARESYDYAMIALRDWTTVQVMSSSGVAAAYSNTFTASNPENPIKLYGKERAIRVKLLSIVLLGGGQGVTPKGATVRFQRSLFDKQTGQSKPMDSKIATMEFSYKSNLRMDDQNRIENPLGFQVTSYRVDNDYASAAPEETQAGASSGDQPPGAQPGTDAQPPGVAPAGAQAPVPGAQPPTTADAALQAAQMPAAPIPAYAPAGAPTAPATQVPAQPYNPAQAPAAPAPRNASNGVGRR